MARNTYLVCLASTVSVCHKNIFGRVSTRSRHIPKLDQSNFLRYLCFQVMPQVYMTNQGLYWLIEPQISQYLSSWRTKPRPEDTKGCKKFQLSVMPIDISVHRLINGHITCLVVVLVLLMAVAKRLDTLTKPGKAYRRGRLSTVDLLALTCLNQLLFKLKI